MTIFRNMWGPQYAGFGGQLRKVYELAIHPGNFPFMVGAVSSALILGSIPVSGQCREERRRSEEAMHLEQVACSGLRRCALLRAWVRARRRFSDPPLASVCSVPFPPTFEIITRRAHGPSTSSKRMMRSILLYPPDEDRAQSSQYAAPRARQTSRAWLCSTPRVPLALFFCPRAHASACWFPFLCPSLLQSS